MTQEIPLKRNWWLLFLISFLFVFAAGRLRDFVPLVVQAVRSGQASAADATLGMAGYYVLIIGGCVYAYAVCTPQLFIRLTEEGVYRPTLRGYQFLRWSDVTGLTLESARIRLDAPNGGVTLNGRLFAPSDGLLQEVKKRVPRQVAKAAIQKYVQRKLIL